jgi:hypothetical protein
MHCLTTIFVVKLAEKSTYAVKGLANNNAKDTTRP